MGAKTWMLVYADANVADALKNHPPLDRAATLKLANNLFPNEKFAPIGEGDLSQTNPPKSELFIGCFPGVSILAAKEFAIDYPSKLQERFIAAGGSGTIYLHAMHSVVDWFAYALWKNGKLIRSLSLSPDSGILENIGDRLAFEEPYWSGQYPTTNSKDNGYPFPFHPLELGESALNEFFGYQLEGRMETDILKSESIPLIKYKRSRPSWRFW